MKKEIVDGATVYSDLMKHDEAFSVNIMIREGGSVCLYLTPPGNSAPAIVFDSLDTEPPSELAELLISELREGAEAINALDKALGAK